MSIAFLLAYGNLFLCIWFVLGRPLVNNSKVAVTATVLRHRSIVTSHINIYQRNASNHETHMPFRSAHDTREIAREIERRQVGRRRAGKGRALIRIGLVHRDWVRVGDVMRERSKGSPMSKRIGSKVRKDPIDKFWVWTDKSVRQCGRCTQQRGDKWIGEMEQ